MQNKKKIGISFTKTNYRYYVEWFTKSDLSTDIEIVELSFEKNNLHDIHQCDGFVLTGGIDIHPSFYNGELSYSNMPDAFQQKRDEFEATLFYYAQTMKLPVLGICRGLQLVNVLMGGKLNQDLGSFGNAIHKKQGELDKTHGVQLQANSLLHQRTKLSLQLPSLKWGL